MTVDYVPGLHYPAVDARVDVTGQYVFRTPGDPSKTTLIMTVNPLAPRHASQFRPDAVYETLIDTDGDARPDISLRCRFTPAPAGGVQRARVTRAVLTVELEDGHLHEELETETLLENAPVSHGADPLITSGSGGVRFFAGWRSDPAFFDVLACANGMIFREPGDDYFTGRNVYAIVLEVPSQLLGGPRTGIWVRTLVPMAFQRDHMTQFDQAGGPFTSLLFNGLHDQSIFARTEPALQAETRNASGLTFLRAFAARLELTGIYAPGEAGRLAAALLPDILAYDYSRPSGFPNGRRLADDTADYMLALLTNGVVSTDHVGPHADYLDEFPYLGTPVSTAAPAAWLLAGSGR
jgi:hypothetical protein